MPQTDEKRAYKRRWYAKHRERINAERRANRAADPARSRAEVMRARDKRRGYVDRVKAKPCADCGVQYPPRVMEFHHIDRTKTATVAQLACTAGMARIKAEIAKCVLLCANCHRLRHGSDR